MAHLGERFYTEEELSGVGFARLGRNVKIKRNAGLFFVENISIGDNVRIDDFTIIVASREPVSFGSYVHVAAHCYLSGSDGISLADFTTLAPGVQIFSSSDDYTGSKLTNVTLPKQVTGGPAGPIALGRHVIIGASSVVLPGVEIAEGCSVGAQSLVTRSLAPWGIYAGIPVRRLRDRKKDLLELEKIVLAQAGQAHR